MAMKQSVALIGILGFAIFLIAANKQVEAQWKKLFWSVDGKIGGYGGLREGRDDIDYNFGGDAVPYFKAYQFGEVESSTDAIQSASLETPILFVPSDSFIGSATPDFCNQFGLSAVVTASTTDPVDIESWPTVPPRLVLLVPGDTPAYYLVSCVTEYEVGL